VGCRHSGGGGKKKEVSCPASGVEKKAGAVQRTPHKSTNRKKKKSLNPPVEKGYDCYRDGGEKGKKKRPSEQRRKGRKMQLIMTLWEGGGREKQREGFFKKAKLFDQREEKG